MLGLIKRVCKGFNDLNISSPLASIVRSKLPHCSRISSPYGKRKYRTSMESNLEKIQKKAIIFILKKLQI